MISLHHTLSWYHSTKVLVVGMSSFIESMELFSDSVSSVCIGPLNESHIECFDGLAYIFANCHCNTLDISRGDNGYHLSPVTLALLPSKSAGRMEYDGFDDFDSINHAETSEVVLGDMGTGCTYST
jgi:hypothetical protein